MDKDNSNTSGWLIALVVLITLLALGLTCLNTYRTNQYHQHKEKVEQYTETLDNYRQQYENVKKQNSDQKQEKRIVNYVDKALKTADIIIADQNIISRQNFQVGTPPKPDNQTLERQKDLKSKVDFNYSPDSLNRGSMSKSAVASNWKVSGADESIDVQVSSLNDANAIHLLFRIKNKDQQPIRFITADYLPNTNKLTKFTQYNTVSGSEED